jgi:hypothetical protein
MCSIIYAENVYILFILKIIYILRIEERVRNVIKAKRKGVKKKIMICNEVYNLNFRLKPICLVFNMNLMIS